MKTPDILPSSVTDVTMMKQLVKVPCCKLNLDWTGKLLRQENVIDYIEIVTNGISYSGGSIVNEQIYSGKLIKNEN